MVEVSWSSSALKISRRAIEVALDWLGIIMILAFIATMCWAMWKFNGVTNG